MPRTKVAKTAEVVAAAAMPERMYYTNSARWMAGLYVNYKGIDQHSRLVDLELAVAALALLIRDEYPRRKLAEIASVWGPELGITAEQIEALNRIDIMEES